ncbi:MAG: DUF1573 domain-containing protein [Candidatus Zixiibacteriota bacterium]|nr:MAG: DUF1573 domain-containing protein [candidate division Zixibacteria bacterium]
MIRRVLPFVCTALFLFTLTGAAAGAPRLVLDESEFDFGFVPQNSKITHSFWVKSQGDDSLKILRVVPGCGCTKAPLERDELAPGDSTRLEIIFSTNRYRNRVSKSPRIETNEGPPHKSVRIAAQVVARPDETFPLVIKPYKLDLSQFGEKVRDKMKFSITNVSDVDLRIKLIDQPDDLFEIDLPAKIGAASEANGTLTLNPAAVESSFEKSFTIEIEDQNRTRFTVPVKRSFHKPGQPATASASTRK